MQGPNVPVCSTEHAGTAEGANKHHPRTVRVDPLARHPVALRLGPDASCPACHTAPHELAGVEDDAGSHGVRPVIPA